MKNLVWLFALLFTVISCKEESQSTVAEDSEKIDTANLTEAEKIAYAYGYENWDDVKNIKFTFNVGAEGQEPFKRHWSWNPKSGDVELKTDTYTVSYNRNSIDSTNMKSDQAFINDKYWLLTPFQFVWDEGTTISKPVMAKSPMDSTDMKKITLTYGAEGGYTPGDAYDFYYGDDYKIKQWVFRKGNTEKASMTTSWENEETINGITVAKDHKMNGRNIYFTDVEIEMEDEK